MTTKRTTKAKTNATATATAPTRPDPQPEAVTESAVSQRTEPQPEQPQQPQQPQRIKDAIKAHQNAIDFIHTALHRTDCAIQLLTRNGYFSTAQHLQQAKVHLRESERSCRSMIRTIRDGNQ